LGQPGRNHTLRIECTDEIFYAYIDSMRLITLKNPGFTAKEIGALKGEGVSYSFLGCTAQALGSSDDLAVKAIPGSFQAVHALNRGEMEEMIVGKQEEKALLMTRAAYPVQVGAEGLYCFDFTVSPQDAGKRITLYLDGEALMETIIPAYTGKRKADLFTFTTAPVSLTQGSHTLEIAAEGALMKEITAFLFQETVAFDSDFTKKAFRQTYLTYGNFSQTNTKGILKNKANKSGFALFGQEGNTDYEMYVRFEIPANGLGNSGIILRVTDLSWYDAQVEESFFGYSLSLSKIGLNVRRIRYGAAGNTDFVSVPAWKDAKEGELIIRAQGSRITISLPDGKELLSFEDADPFTHGKFGFFSTGKELTVLELNVKPL